MVMIPKPGKDHAAVRGWRPIVLANTVSKLAEKIIAQELQKRQENMLSRGGREGVLWIV